MIRDASPSDLPAIRELLASANDGPYDIGTVAQEKCFGAGVAGKPRTRIFQDANGIRGVAVVCGQALRVLAVDRDFRRRAIGSTLLRDAGPATRVVFAEAGNYFTPGIVETDEGTRAFFRAHGFVEARWTHNLEASDLPERVPPAAQRVTDRAGFLDFVEREFGAIWRFEAARAFERDPATAFWIPDIGFAVHDANNRGLGAFGPTGVARAHREKGYGRQLLLASLADLRRIGFERVVIPWTDAIEFYRKACRARVTHRFVTMTKG